MKISITQSKGFWIGKTVSYIYGTAGSFPRVHLESFSSSACADPSEKLFPVPLISHGVPLQTTVGWGDLEVQVSCYREWSRRPHVPAASSAEGFAEVFW